MTRGPEAAKDYVIQVFADPTHVAPRDWNRLVDLQPGAAPFQCHEFLAALHESGCAVPSTGWHPQFVTVHRAGRLVAASPVYAKDHSYGEYVFDWAWADAYRRHGLAYFPKLVAALPFTPVPGARLLAEDDAARLALLAALEGLVQARRASSAHLLFTDEADLRAARRRGWLVRDNVQFHWRNREAPPFADFDDFLASLKRDKRKKIAQERRRVAEAGVVVRPLRATEASARDWDFFFDCYERTYLEHGHAPYLSRDFFARIAAAQAEHWLLFVAERGTEPIASSLIAIDEARRHAWGRYWGALQHVPCLHFEACYYAPLQWCIAEGYACFEGGAQGEHKMARGLLPVATHSAHWLAHPQFSRAVADFLERESAGVEAYVDELRERNPFRPATDRVAGADPT
jgi:hypothetical protein